MIRIGAWIQYCFTVLISVSVLSSALAPAQARLNENCVVSILNRTSQVQSDGTWVLPNIPANFGQVRARATCVENGLTTSGQSDFFLITANDAVDAPSVTLDSVDPIPADLGISSPSLVLNETMTSLQLTVIATFADGSTADVSAAAKGTNYTVSNPNVATVDADGQVTAVMSGRVLVSAILEGAIGLIELQVVFSGDSDGDGIPDDLELASGLNPNNPVDGLEDADRDGLTNKEELVDFGTDFRVADTDNDGIDDGEELIAGNNGFITNPLLADTDGDGLSDGLEVATASDPTDPNSFNLADALASIALTPASSLITVNTIIGQASRQLSVTGTLIDNNEIDLTSTSRGTNYNSSDLFICNFGAEDAKVFAAGDSGVCTITATNSGFTASASVIVNSFSPTALSAVAIPGYANNVDVSGSYAYVVAGASGLQIVDVSDPRRPVIAGAIDTPGNANDVRAIGSTIYVADALSLIVINASDPGQPAITGEIRTPGDAQDIVVVDELAYIADGAAGGLQIIDVSNPAAPSIAGSVDTPGTAKGVDISGDFAIVAEGSPSNAVRVIDISNPAAPQIVGELLVSGDVRSGPKDLAVRDNLAYIAAYTQGFLVVDFSDPSAPQLVSSLPGSAPTGFIPRDVAISNRFALAAEELFNNATPILDLADASNPIFRDTLEFRRFGDYSGTGISLTPEMVYMTGERFVVRQDKGTVGDTRLFIGQYLFMEDTAGIDPLVDLVAPGTGITVLEGETVVLRAQASDDIGVAAVDFVVNDEIIFTDTAAPFVTSYTVPTGASFLSISARAIDFGSNLSALASVSINVIPDPLTTAVGFVTDEQGVALSGAEVSCLDMTASSDVDGRFAIIDLPTIAGDIQCSVTFTTATNQTLTGRSTAVAPVRGGTSDMGTIIARPSRFETELGTNLQQTQDDFDLVPFTQGFTFPYAGLDRTEIYVNSNGNLTFEAGDSNGPANQPADDIIEGLPRIAPLYTDIQPQFAFADTGVYVNQFPDRFVATWNRVRETFKGGENTFQVILFADGRIQFGYNGLTADGSSSGEAGGDLTIAISPGGTPALAEVDFTEQAPFNIPNGGAVLEYFFTEEEVGFFDLDGGFILFQPDGNGGYDVDVIPPDELPPQ